jgi:hypothetical protein
MAKNNKFLSLLEKYQSRFEQKGFLVGDVIKFDDNFKSHESYKDLPDNVKEVLDSYIDSGLHIRVTSVDGSGEMVVAQDHGGGRFVGKVTIPCCLGAPVDFGDNLAPIPEVQRHETKVDIKPVEVPELPENPTDAPTQVPHEGGNTTHPIDEEDEEVVEESAKEDTSYTQQYL